MPCLVVTGHPCSGKTTFAEALVERASASPEFASVVKRVVVVNEESVLPSTTRSERYADARAEKETRSSLKAEFDRASLPRNANDGTLVIVDSLNYVKGYRYELHCVTKAVGDRHGVVWTVCPPETASRWNRERRTRTNENEDAYDEETVRDLMQRYEPPNERHRWDRPLFRVDVLDLVGNDDGDRVSASVRSNDDVAADVLERSVYDMHSLSEVLRRDAANDDDDGARRVASSSSDDDADPGLDELRRRADEVLREFLLGDRVRDLKEGRSTARPVEGGSDALHRLDAVARKTADALVRAQSAAGATPGGRLSVVPDRPLVLRRRVHLPEARRLQREFVRWTSTRPPEDTSEAGVARAFLDYVEANVR